MCGKCARVVRSKRTFDRDSTGLAVSAYVPQRHDAVFRESAVSPSSLPLHRGGKKTKGRAKFRRNANKNLEFQQFSYRTNLEFQNLLSRELNKVWIILEIKTQNSNIFLVGKI